MGGGSGGYDRPSDDDGGNSDTSDEDGSNSVPPPESEPEEEEATEDQSDESSGTSDRATPQSPPPTGGGGGGGAPVAGPGEGSDGEPEESDSESEQEESPQNENGEDGESEGPGDDNGHNDEESDRQSPTNPSPEEEPDDSDANEDAQDRRQKEREGEHEDNQERERDEEEDEDDEREEDEEEDEDDECLISESAILHSPNPEPLGDADEGDICSVRLRDEAICIVDLQSRTIGSIAEPWVGTLKECIKQGRQYRARILDIDGGKCEVRVTNKCLLNQNIKLTNINTAVRDQLHPELSLSVETTPEEVIVVMDNGSRVGDVSDPWARLLDECIDEGLAYQVGVRDVTPEYCRVNIQIETSDE